MARSTANTERNVTPPPEEGRTRKGWGRRIALILVGLVALVLLAVLIGALWLRGQMNDSLPMMEGELTLPGLAAPVQVERDGLGVPTISGDNRVDVARALGFVHAQDRFFQMDLTRRRAAGEISEVFGAVALPVDRDVRLHRLRAAAERAFAEAPAGDRTLLEAYAAGVNAGLAALEAPPFEYLLLRSEPAQWLPEDTFLVVFGMYLELQDPNFSNERMYSVMRETLPEPLYAFLTPLGSEWDAPLFGDPIESVPVPGPEVVDLRAGTMAPAHNELEEEGEPAEEENAGEEDVEQEAAEAAALWLPPGAVPGGILREKEVAGSNSWAVAGEHTTHGGALLANDMHLPFSVPHIWYRASLRWPNAASGEERSITGVTLPGTPMVVVGSNGHVAWGFTNSQTDTSDLIILGADPATSDTYPTPDGPQPFERHQQILRTQEGGEETLEVVTTRWGPVLPEPDALGRRLAVSWVAHHSGAVNLGLAGLESATTVDEAVEIANRSGLPAQNFVVADRDGRIAWTLAGVIPSRQGFDGRVATSWADGEHRWEGLMAREELPRLLDPPSGRIWTANNRVVSGEDLARLGSADFVGGARAKQIRDRLLELERASEEDMLALQLDDRALFLERWHRVFSEAVANAPEPGTSDRTVPRADLRETLEDWTGRASTDTIAFRLVRVARLMLAEDVLGSLAAPALDVEPKLGYPLGFFHFEAPLWRLVQERPQHLLPPEHETWDDALIAALNTGVERIETLGKGPIDGQTWGRRNTLRMSHPLSRAVPALSRWLDMPAEALPGDSHMPRVQSPFFGASERLAVSPGREPEGIFHMPGGQSGHPFSPHYHDSHAAWAKGEAAPFLPGEAVYRLTLVPGG